MKNNTKKIEFKKKTFIILLILSAVAGGSVLYTSIKIASWSNYKYTQWKTSERDGFFSGWKELFEKCGLSVSSRAEDLSLSEFASLADEISRI